VPYPTQPGQVGGHEGVGIVVKLGPGSENGRIKLGDRVGIKVRTFLYSVHLDLILRYR
jgi:propanol-preferring alcohol dehydrogenase